MLARERHPLHLELAELALRRGVELLALVRMRFHHMPSGTSFSDLQITAHDQQPMQRSTSTAMPHFGCSLVGPISP